MANREKKPTNSMSPLNVSKALPIDGETPEALRCEIANAVASAAVAASRAIQATEGKNGLGKHLDTPELIKCLRDQAAAVNRGDLAQPEAMLMNQATVLQSLFARLIERGMGCEHIPGFEVNLRMALRAQSQCRATLETLATIKNPPVVYARQANVTSGPQQINNGMATPPRAGEIENEPTQLLRADHGQRLDTGTTGATSGADMHLEAVGAIDRPNVRRR